MRTRTIFFAILCSLLLLTSCSKKSISLKTAGKSPYLVLKLEKADLYLAKKDVLEAAKLEIEREKFNKRKERLKEAYQFIEQASFDTLSFPIKLDSSVNDMTIINAHLLVYFTYYELLKQGKLKVFNKLSRNFESKIYYKILKSKLGQKTELFYLPDGTEFYDQVITFGE